MDSDSLDALAKRLYAAHPSAVPLGYAEAAIEGVWKPEPKKCHENASTWAANNQGWSAVRGWSVLDLTNAFLILKPVVHFVAHSAVRDPYGKLWDITPADILQPFPFFPHPGTDEDFQELVEVHKLATVDYFPAG